MSKLRMFHSPIVSRWLIIVCTASKIMIHLDTPTTSLGHKCSYSLIVLTGSKASPHYWPQLRASKLRPQDPWTEASCVWSLDKVGLSFACSLVTSDLRQSQAVRSVCSSRQLAALLHVNYSKGSSTRYSWSGEETTNGGPSRGMRLCFAAKLVLFPFGLVSTPWMRARHCQAAHRVSCTCFKSCLQTLFDVSQ
ncbi:Uncharacterized protein HZ326_20145 [Fusarium oxysporum f. sp. albedinis]|nr:Uncharacterized protein HZ326_20145 [Fusarium oxysporum f. sp. albedinis]